MRLHLLDDIHHFAPGLRIRSCHTDLNTLHHSIVRQGGDRARSLYAQKGIVGSEGLREHRKKRIRPHLPGESGDLAPQLRRVRERELATPHPDIVPNRWVCLDLAQPCGLHTCRHRPWPQAFPRNRGQRCRHCHHPPARPT
jgi:hypothetical protein